MTFLSQYTHTHTHELKFLSSKKLTNFTWFLFLSYMMYFIVANLKVPWNRYCFLFLLCIFWALSNTTIWRELWKYPSVVHKWEGLKCFLTWNLLIKRLCENCEDSVDVVFKIYFYVLSKFFSSFIIFHVYCLIKSVYMLPTYETAPNWMSSKYFRLLMSKISS